MESRSARLPHLAPCCRRMTRLLTCILLTTLSFWAVASDESLGELRAACSSSDNIESNCNRYIAAGGTDYTAFIRLANQYKKSGNLKLAAEIFEKALEQHKTNIRLSRKISNQKSNINEEIWLKTAPRISSEDGILRGKCLKLAKVIPKTALRSCQQYLESNANDREVLEIVAAITSKSRAKSSEKPIVVAESPQPAPPIAAQTTVDQKPGKDPIKAQETIIPEPKISVKETLSQGVVGSASVTASTVNPGVIQDIRTQLQELYSLIEEKAVQQPELVSPSNVIAEKGKRYAVVVGNANYDPRIGKLKNPVNDASDIAAALKQLGFSVDLLIDTDLVQMERAIESMSKNAQSEDTLLFYFAGHGVALDGENYLIPANTALKDSIDIRYKALRLSYALERMDRAASGSGVTIVMLDACRNNPFVGERGTARGGLATVSGPSGSLIAFATAPGMVAQDGDGRNGVYTKYLLRHITKPGLQVEDMFKRVRVDVESATEGQQIPWENSSMRGSFYFNKF